MTGRVDRKKLFPLMEGSKTKIKGIEIKAEGLEKMSLIFLPAEKQLDEKEEAELLAWEAIIKENYLIKQKRHESQSLNQQINYTMMKVDAVAEALDINREGSKMEQRISHLEEQMMQTVNALNWIVNTLIENNFGSRESASALATWFYDSLCSRASSAGVVARRMSSICDSKATEEEIEPEAKELKPMCHVHARSLVYP
eukprot:g42626.t1